MAAPLILMGFLNSGAMLQYAQYYATKEALSVMVEADNTANHANRVALAKKILTGNFYWQSFVLAYLTNATVAALNDPTTALPGDIEYITVNAFNAIANANV